VTAEKRKPTVQTTAISLTAVSGAYIRDRGLSDLGSLVQSVSGVTLRTSGPGMAEFEMRGVASTGGNSPTVGFYYDDTPLTAPAAINEGKIVISPALYDLNRVAVLRGPPGDAVRVGLDGRYHQGRSQSAQPGRVRLLGGSHFRRYRSRRLQSCRKRDDQSSAGRGFGGGPGRRILFARQRLDRSGRAGAKIRNTTAGHDDCHVRTGCSPSRIDDRYVDQGKGSIGSCSCRCPELEQGRDDREDHSNQAEARGLLHEISRATGFLRASIRAM
jgi:hypothetical protein